MAKFDLRDPASPTKKKAPKRRLAGYVEQPIRASGRAGPPADWRSLVADLSLAAEEREPEWRIHDRTHLEFAVDYRLRPNEAEQTFVWDAYFFVPESLRLHDQTYEKNEIYEDLQSYIRLAVPRVAFTEIAAAPIDRLTEAVRRAKEEGAREAALRELRLFACFVRSSGVDAQRRILDLLKSKAPEDRVRACDAALKMTRAAELATEKLRDVVDRIPESDAELVEAGRWIEEDVSCVLESLLATLALELRSAGEPEPVATQVAAGAIAQARYRADEGFDGVGHADADERDVEHLEFRRHLLKRFTSSVLWLTLEVRRGGEWALQLLHAIAASVAMSFAVIAALWHGTTAGPNLWAWALAVIAAYAAKDRIKAFLQTAFARVVSRYFPDRKWRIFDLERRFRLGDVKERSGFVAQRLVPPEALRVRRRDRRQALQDTARPERVLWHHKTCTVNAAALKTADARFEALTEIFRLNVRRWLDHTDDPKRKIVFADPHDQHIYSAVARRVYNIAVVYRLRRAGDVDAPWHRVRVVVTRKGILRIDPVC